MPEDLASGVRRFQRDVFPAKAELFRRLATGQAPDALYIGCSDSRVVPELVTQREPGELFVIRTAGNLVPVHTPYGDGVAASIEYAVVQLGVTDVVVCGHSACGAMSALAEGADLSAMPAVAEWLRYADAAVVETADVAPSERTAALIRANVLLQLSHLAKYACVAEAMDRGALTLHGWVFDIGTGAVEGLTPVAGA
ncbi:carbonic anhydrase [Streptomyces flavofungini]|uniref:carbonic anhydrase n=1 Tax=Streptomyces flavofungini TaxID=68200 RepID=UPI0034E003C8